ncbi:MAG: hypothetical protein AB7P03_25765 [Kofleriaceae bacterium]
MISRAKLLATVLSLSMVGGGVVMMGAGCRSETESNRWVTTENTNVKIDWDKVNEAYKAANGPEDLEKRINEIYEGDEVISIAVKDEGTKAQIVTGFFDKNTSGSVDEGEQIFTIKREVTGEGTATYQTTGYGAYHGYTSPMFSIASGMLMGAMLSNMFMPSYVPMYTQPYVTTASRAGAIHSSRSAYRAANPSRFQKSQSGRMYNSRSKPGSRPSAPMRSRGGGRFGLNRAGRTTRPVRLSV